LHVTLGEIIFDKKELIRVESDMKVEEVAAIFDVHNILSAPVWDKEQNQYIGIVDMFEIMRFTAAGLKEQLVFKDDLFSSFEFAEETVKELISKSNRSKRICVFDATDPLYAAIRPLSQNDHTVLVRAYDEKDFKSTYRVVCQSDVVQHLYKNCDSVQQLCGRKIKELGVTKSPVIGITTKQTALEGLYEMFQHQINAVAVVDDESKLVGTLSVSDLRGINASIVQDLNLPVLDFLKKLQRFEKPVTCGYEDSLREVMSKITSAHIRRVWLVEKSMQKPQAVLTLTDILRFFANVPESK